MNPHPGSLAHLRHELRTPLNHILGYSEMLLEDAGEAGDLARELQAVRGEGRALLAVVEESLAPVRVEAGGVDVGRLASDIALPLDRLDQSVSRLVRLAAQGHPGSVTADAQRIGAAVARLRSLVWEWTQGGGTAAPTQVPAHRSSEADRAPGSTRRGPAATPAAILVVDDDQENRELLARRLTREGHRVRMASGGTEALALLQTQPVDLVLLDVMMPDLDGPTVLARLKQDPERRHIPVLMISALDETASVVRAIELGAEDYLPKPCDPVLLRARIGACLEKKRLLDQEAQHALALADWNRTLEQRVQEGVAQVERLGRLKRFFSPQLAELIVAGGTDDPLRTHRREITVVFLDLRGFTGFAETAEPEEVMGVLREYHEAMGRLIVGHEGTLERFTGDGMMVFFNDPVPVENPAERAVRMAVAMRDRVRELRAGWRKRGHDLDLGVGIAQGYATIGAIGFEGRWDYGAIGTVTNLAARLCAEAQGGQVLVTSRVAAAVEGLVDVEEVGALSLRGLSRPVPTLNIAGLKRPA
jgi:class 3 adenylate cyclase/AmiR/NasT family two-component response regulator